MGNFDGVHLGHRAVIAAALEMGRAHGRPALAVTFEPHPRSFFSPNTPQFRLSDETAKLRLLAGTGLAGAVVMTFDKTRAGTTAQDFIHHDLIERLGISGIAVGYDFHFGKGRVGSPSLLVSEAPRLGIEVDVQPHVDIDERPVSSSAIRMALAEGQIEDATAMLGGPWFVTGEVIHGEKRGRELGYPTANIRLDKNCGLKHGIYAVRVGRGERTLRRRRELRPPPDLRQRRAAAGNLPVRLQGRSLRRGARRRLHRLHPRGTEIRQRRGADPADGRRFAPAPARSWRPRPDAFPKLGEIGVKTEKQKMLAGELYRPDAELGAEQAAAKSGWRATTTPRRYRLVSATRCSANASAMSARTL